MDIMGFSESIQDLFDQYKGKPFEGTYITAAKTSLGKSCIQEIIPNYSNVVVQNIIAVADRKGLALEFRLEHFSIN